MFLSHKEVTQLTGYTQQGKQKQWLLDSGFVFAVRCDGLPSVLYSHVEKVLGGKIGKSKKEETPNVDDLKEVLNG